MAATDGEGRRDTVRGHGIYLALLISCTHLSFRRFGRVRRELFSLLPQKLRRKLETLEQEGRLMTGSFIVFRKLF